MSVELHLAGRIHAEFCEIVRLSMEMDDLAKEDFMTIGRRESHALDILSKAARVHNGARVLLGAASPELVALDGHPFCKSWSHNFAKNVNTRCSYDRGAGALATCESCASGYLPCANSMSNPAYVQRGMAACRRMRDRYEHYEAYFTGNGRFQVAHKGQPAAELAEGESWIEETISGGLNGDELRLDVLERSGRMAYTLNARETAQALKPVARAATLHPKVYDERHEMACEFCI